nr:hypothetical protein [Roseovarius sp. W115]MDV2928399.1 hypothetical protein [Roseovarius sp. W115]
MTFPESIGFAASVWALVQAGWFLSSWVLRAAKGMVKKTYSLILKYKIVRAERLVELEEKEAVLRIVVSEVDGLRETLESGPAERIAS